MKKNNKILLIGGSGSLGSSILKLKLFKNIDSPPRKDLNLLNTKSIKKFLNKKYNLIINCADLARMRECEKEPEKAININIFGTLNLVSEILSYQNRNKIKIKLIHISTDGVYESEKGNYKENDFLKPSGYE